MIETARNASIHRTVIVCSVSREPIPGDLRASWVAHRFRDDMDSGRIRLFHLAEDWMPQHPSDAASPQAFFGAWAGVLRALSGVDVDALFTSEEYGDSLAKYLDAVHVKVDPARERFPVSGTAVRGNPKAHLHYLNAEVARYFAR